ncbi:replication initiator [Nonomuraea sp. 3-1Str]|uniref:replication initiator n=1 Tax=Nonomuraea sp. 3-1Str TaxID=2929801 RepID=UPI0028705319|nr:replication initiator [Nonomuraea sp. 3-1Str]
MLTRIDQPRDLAFLARRTRGHAPAGKCLGYLTKYLTKSLADPLDATADNATRREHAARLVEALRTEPCSPTCANWLRYGSQPKNAKPGMLRGRHRGKAHKPDHLGYAGRRVPVPLG